ncbi:MAG: hypothetical protein ACYC3X_03515 [Pirellulaceae bacterium]
MSLFSNRWNVRTSLAVLVLMGLLSAHCAAMVYRPSVGRFKDGFILWDKGQFYLFSMYTPGDEANFRNVWLATSSDGVHWKHVGPVIKDAPFNIWAMSVHKIGDRFIMNHGSFTRPGVQNVIRFWESQDLGHWTFMGHEADLLPDSRWYPADSRLDCMSVVPVVANGQTKYYGFATGPGGFLESEDGIRWSGMPRPQVDWDAVPPPPTPPDEGGFEVGGCHEIDGRYYLVGGWFNYMYSGYTYETGETWLPPLKKAVVDPGGHLRLGYWKGNDALQGAPVTVDLSTCRKIFPDAAQGECSCHVVANRLEIQAQPERNSILRTNIPTTVAILDNTFDFNRGVVIEGTLQATCRDRRLVASSVGFYLEEQPGEGTAILLHSQGRTEIGKLTLADRIDFRPEDTIGPGCAAPAGIMPHTNHTFRLLIRKNMFELYLDEMLVQTFNTTHEPGSLGLTPQRLGFIAENGQGLFENIRAWSMTLEE